MKIRLSKNFTITSNHVSGRAFWDKLPECIFENFEISKTRAISKFLKITRVIYLKNCPNQPCSYWLITQNQQTLCIETTIFWQWAVTKSASGQLQNRGKLQNNSDNGTNLITINRVIQWWRKEDLGIFFLKWGCVVRFGTICII